MIKDYAIKTSVYEGPLDALLDLIVRRKLFINDIALASVADDFIAYVESMQDYPVALTSEFLVIASTLLLIKSKSLLPNLSLSVEETQEVTDLELRLALLAEFKQIAQALRTHLDEQKNQYLYAPRGSRKYSKEIIFTPHESITPQALAQAILDAVHSIPQVEHRPQIAVKQVVSIEEMIHKLHERVHHALSTSFRDFSGYGKREKVEVIVSFLALLELVKRGVIVAKQHDQFTDITLEVEQVSVPQI